MKKVMLIWIVFILVVLLAGLVVANPDEVTALRAELASTKAELNKIKYAGVPSIELQIKPAPTDWKDAYGDTKDTQFYFNIKSALVDIEQCKRAIRLLADTITDITNPADPNSLVSRIAVLEEKVADMPVIERLEGLSFGINTVESNPVEGYLRFIYTNAADPDEGYMEFYTGNAWVKWDKPDDPKEVAK